MSGLELDDQSLERAVRSEVGEHAEIRKVATGVFNTMSIVVEAAEEVIGQDIVVFWVDKSFPECFSLPLLTPAVAIFNGSYVELTASVEGILTEGLPWEVFGELIEQVTRRVIAELALHHGDPALACYLMAKSLVGSTVNVIPISLIDLELWPIDEKYMTVWFYALLHELGHIHAEKSDVNIVPPDLDLLVENLVTTLEGEEQSQAILQVIRSTQGHSLDPEVLLRELDADRFSVQVLFMATAKALELLERPQDFSVDRLCTEILEVFTLQNSLNGCAIVARHCADFSFNAAQDPWWRIAVRVRLNVVVELLARLVVAYGYVEASPTAVDELHRRLFNWYEGEDRMASVAVFDRAQISTIEECLIPAKRDLGMLNRLATQMEDFGKGLFASFEIDRFLGLAGSLGVKHPDLDLLAAMRADPSRASTILHNARRIFYVLRIRSSGQLLVLKSRDILVTFVFITNDLALMFMRKFQGWFGHPLRVATVESPSEHDITVALHQDLQCQGNDRLRVVFEGSGAFKEYAKELEDGTFWETPPS
jgi:hypothetical protein